MTRVTAVGLLLTLLAPAGRAEEPASASEAKKDDDGVLVHEVRSPYQAKPTRVRVLPPERVKKGRQYPAVYVLPVEAGAGGRYGDGLGEVRRHDLHNTLPAVSAAPTFAHLPWSAGHPTGPGVRRESHPPRAAVPLVERTCPVRAGAGGRPPGLSKSGWGAWPLPLRHPGRSGRAAAWDAPPATDRPGEYGSGDGSGTADDPEGCRVGKRVADRAGRLGRGRRLTLLGYGDFRAGHEQARALPGRLKVPHEYRDGPAREHDRHSGWVQEAAELLVGK